MSKKYTDNSRYKSQYGGGWITDAQYLAEIMCERQANRRDEGLCIKFWNTNSWKKQFQLQVLTAHIWLKKYSGRAVVSAVKSKSGSRVFSLTARNLLKPLIEKEQNLLDKLADAIPDSTNIPVADISQKPRKPFSTKQSKFRGLDE